MRKAATPRLSRAPGRRSEARLLVGQPAGGLQSPLHSILRIKPTAADKLKETGPLYTAPVERGRDARFRIEVVVVAYKHTCALTGYRMTTLEMESIVDAAHIHEFSDSRNNDPRNGLALAKNAHWQSRERKFAA